MRDAARELDAKYKPKITYACRQISADSQLPCVREKAQQPLLRQGPSRRGSEKRQSSCW